jgi:hypothetical protein
MIETREKGDGGSMKMESSLSSTRARHILELKQWSTFQYVARA